MNSWTSRSRFSRPQAAVIAIPILLLTIAVACSKTETAAPPKTTVFQTLATLATTTTEGPTTSRAPTTPTTRVTTTTFPEVKGKFEVIPSGRVSSSYPYPALAESPTSTPALTWNIPLEAGQKLSIHGPAPGTTDAELSTVSAGSFALCPGAIANSTCTLTPGRFTYTADVKDGSGTVVATTTADLNVSG